MMHGGGREKGNYGLYKMTLKSGNSFHSSKRHFSH